MIVQIMTPATIIFRLLLLFTLLTALRWGGRPERQVAGLYILAATLSYLARVNAGLDFTQFVSSIAALDAGLLIGLGAIASKVRRWWLFATTALQILTCLGHLAKLLDPATSTMGYFMMLVSSSYPSLILLMLGTVQYHREQSLARCSNGLSKEGDRPKPG